MASRIRYEKTTKEGIYESVRNFHSDSTDAMYFVILDINKCEYTIRNMTSKRSYNGGDDINNLHVLKRHIKERLEGLGVNFDKEVRDNSTRVKGVNCSYVKKEE